jgi:hypothetical protein
MDRLFGGTQEFCRMFAIIEKENRYVGSWRKIDRLPPFRCNTGQNCAQFSFLQGCQHSLLSFSLLHRKAEQTG